MPRDAFVLKIQRELWHPYYARKVSELSRNRPLGRKNDFSVRYGKEVKKCITNFVQSFSQLHYSNSYTGIKSCSVLCWTLCIVGQKGSTWFLMEALSDCFPFSSCLLLREYWNLVPINNNIRVKETKLWLPLKTWRSFSILRCAAYHKKKKQKFLMPVFSILALYTHTIVLRNSKVHY